MRACVAMYRSSIGLRHRLQKSDGRPLPVGARNVDDLRTVMVWIVKFLQQLPQSIKRQIDTLGMQRQKVMEQLVARARLRH